MKSICFAFAFFLTGIICCAQSSKEATNLVSEGVTLNDRGEYDAALKKYDEAIKLDKEYYNAWYEKTFTLYEMGKKKECISLCKDIIKKFSDNPALSHVYIQYGSSLDDLGKPKDAIEIYDEGIKSFPNVFLLHFNKGLTLQKLEKYEDALLSYQASLKLKPTHSSSNLFTGLLLQPINKIPALLAYATFMAIEPKTKRSEEALQRIEYIIGANVKKEGNNTSITLDASMLMGDKGSKKAENNFRMVELIFSFSNALDGNKSVDSVFASPVEKLSLKLQLLINSLAENMKDNKGFYWEHYVPFFVDMKEKNLVGTLCYLIYAQSGDEANTKWVEGHDTEIQEFYDWIKNFKWKR